MGYHGLDDGAGAEIGGNNRNFVSVDISWGASGASIRVNHWEKEGVGDGHGDPTRGRGVGGGGRARYMCVCVVHNLHVQLFIAHSAHPSTIVQAHPSQEFLREDRVLVPGGAITPLWRLGAPWKRD